MAIAHCSVRMVSRYDPGRHQGQPFSDRHAQRPFGAGLRAGRGGKTVKWQRRESLRYTPALVRHQASHPARGPARAACRFERNARAGTLRGPIFSDIPPAYG
jgi:hypothetical protein